MARIHHVKSAQQRYRTVPVLNEDGTPKITPVMRKDGTPKKTKRGKEITRRVTAEDRSQPLPNRKCDKCGNEIKPGDPYKWAKVKSGPYGGRMLVRCGTCPTWKPSEMSSSKMAGIYAAQERADEEAASCESVDDLEALRDELADDIEAVGDEYEESAQNMEDGFGHETSMSEELRQKAEDIKSWADDIRNVEFDDYDGEEQECETCGGEGELDDPDHDDADGRGKIKCEDCDGTGIADDDGSAAEDHWQEQRDKLIDEIGNCPV